MSIKTFNHDCTTRQIREHFAGRHFTILRVPEHADADWKGVNVQITSAANPSENNDETGWVWVADRNGVSVKNPATRRHYRETGYAVAVPLPTEQVRVLGSNFACIHAATFDQMFGEI